MPAFLETYQSELLTAGIEPTWLQGRHVRPLIRFMAAHGIVRVYATDNRGRCWYLDVDGDYANPLTKMADRRSGNAHNLNRQGVPLGVVFEGQNGERSFWRGYTVSA